MNEYIKRSSFFLSSFFFRDGSNLDLGDDVFSSVSPGEALEAVSYTLKRTTDIEENKKRNIRESIPEQNSPISLFGSTGGSFGAGSGGFNATFVPLRIAMEQLEIAKKEKEQRLLRERHSQELRPACTLNFNAETVQDPTGRLSTYVVLSVGPTRLHIFDVEEFELIEDFPLDYVRGTDVSGNILNVIVFDEQVHTQQHFRFSSPHAVDIMTATQQAINKVNERNEHTRVNLEHMEKVWLESPSVNPELLGEALNEDTKSFVVRRKTDPSTFLPHLVTLCISGSQVYVMDTVTGDCIIGWAYTAIYGWEVTKNTFSATIKGYNARYSNFLFSPPLFFSSLFLSSLFCTILK